MISFLSSVAGYVLTAVLSAIAGWIAKWIHGIYADIIQDEKARNDAHDSVQPLKDAGETDAKAIDDASKSALGGL
jgi:hypothetical protein